jgi:ribosome maturation factor RimP
MDLKKVEDLIKPLIEQSGYTVYDVEFVGRTLRVSIEKPDGQIGINDCVETSRMLNPLLDVEDLISGGRYELEVSSPGLDRNLRRPEHFEKAKGSKIHVTTREALSVWNGSDPFYEKRKNIKGLIREFDGVTLKLNEDGGREVVVPFDAVVRAYMDFELKVTPKKGKNNG